jgi:membrane-bound metal-dependent hydrolase YbcI (DUF457 family)
MSSFGTHALIGAVGGLALAQGLELTGHTLPIQAQADALAPGAGTMALVGISAFVALVPDIDEPNSWIGQRVVRVGAFAGLVLSGMLGLSAGGLTDGAGGLGAAGLLGAAVAAGMGAVIGGFLASVLLRGIRTAAGGHRRLTHSFILAGMFAAIAGALVVAGLPIWAQLPAALAWGIVLHDLGDVVTPAGVPVLYPLSERDLHLLPEPLRGGGEAIAGGTAKQRTHAPPAPPLSRCCRAMRHPRQRCRVQST